MLHLLHLPIAPRAFAEWSGQRGMATRSGGFDEGLALHRLLAAAFGEGAAQPFRLFTPERGDWSLYAYAGSPAEELTRLARQVAPPDILAVLPLERLRGKPMPDGFAPGTRLGFDLRARPVRRGKVETDCFLWEANKAHEGDPGGMAAAGRSREAVYADWLRERLAGAATLETCRLVRFRRLRVQRTGRAVEGPDATLQGTLAVTDGQAFAQALGGGVGRHKAYGFGMLMLRPPDRRAPDR